MRTVLVSFLPTVGCLLCFTAFIRTKLYSRFGQTKIRTVFLSVWQTFQKLFIFFSKIFLERIYVFLFLQNCFKSTSFFLKIWPNTWLWKKKKLDLDKMGQTGYYSVTRWRLAFQIKEWWNIMVIVFPEAKTKRSFQSKILKHC